MVDKDTALKKAIEALELINEHAFRCGLAKEAINACKEALKSQEQEPVAWMKSALDNARDVCKYLDHEMIKEAKAHTKFFWNDIEKIKEPDTHPAPAWQGLSDDERHEVIVKYVAVDCTCDPYEFARAIEQALKEKNT